jgi:hypothetical protein
MNTYPDFPVLQFRQMVWDLRQKYKSLFSSSYLISADKEQMRTPCDRFISFSLKFDRCDLKSPD